MTDLLGDGLLSVAEVCLLTGMRKSFWYAVMDAGDLPYVKLGSSRRIPRRAVLDYCNERLIGGMNNRIAGARR